MLLSLTRYQGSKDATMGILCVEDKYVCDTLELPWMNNHHEISCIPEGSYKLTLRQDSEAHVKLGYLVDGVLDRSGIMIHAANKIDELRGCIAPGVKCGESVFHSTFTLQNIINLIGTEAVLDIRRFKI